VAFILALWSESPASEPPVWRGYLETADGRRRYFWDLPDLLDTLRELLLAHAPDTGHLPG
jgi:hypothetical protein